MLVKIAVVLLQNSILLSIISNNKIARIVEKGLVRRSGSTFPNRRCGLQRWGVACQRHRRRRRWKHHCCRWHNIRNGGRSRKNCADRSIRNSVGFVVSVVRRGTRCCRRFARAKHEQGTFRGCIRGGGERRRRRRRPRRCCWAAVAAAGGGGVAKRLVPQACGAIVAIAACAASIDGCVGIGAGISTVGSGDDGNRGFAAVMV